MKFRKKPVVIDAVRIDDLFTKDVRQFPTWVQTAFEHGAIRHQERTLAVDTLEGRMVGGRSDWLIRGVQGELYPCKPDIFAATYEPVEETT